jgi:hypothetical protein
MKKLSSLFVFVLCCIAPVFSQEENEGMLIEDIVVNQDEVPADILNSFHLDFSDGVPVKWSLFPYLFEEYGWRVVPNEGLAKTSRYAVVLKAQNGSEFHAVYDAKGKLIRSREILKNCDVLPSIKKKLSQTEYKDWKVDSDKELIKDFEYYMKKHYVIRVMKDEKKKVLYFDQNGRILADRRISLK